VKGRGDGPGRRYGSLAAVPGTPHSAAQGPGCCANPEDATRAAGAVLEASITPNEAVLLTNLIDDGGGGSALHFLPPPRHIGAWSAGTPTDLTPLLTMNGAVRANCPCLSMRSHSNGAVSLLHGGPCRIVNGIEHRGRRELEFGGRAQR